MNNKPQLDEMFEILRENVPPPPNAIQNRMAFLHEAQRLADSSSASHTGSWFGRLQQKIDSRLPQLDNRRWIPVLTCLAMIFLIVSMVVAQQLFEIFRQSENDQQEIPVQYGMGGVGINRPIAIEEAQARVDYAIALPDYIPEPYQSMEIYYWEAENSLSIHYHCGSYRQLILSQTPLRPDELAQLENGDVGFLDVGASAEIESIPIGETTGQYVRGTWIAKNNTRIDYIDGKWTVVYENNGEFATAIPGSQFPADAIWENDSELQRLYWYSDGILYRLSNIGSRIDVGTANECALDRDDYVAVANSLILLSD